MSCSVATDGARNDEITNPRPGQWSLLASRGLASPDIGGPGREARRKSPPEAQQKKDPALSRKSGVGDVASPYPRRPPAGGVMPGRIWAPPDCNKFGKRWRSQLLTYIQASLCGVSDRRRRREPRWIFARFHLNVAKALAGAMPVQTSGSGSDGVTVSPSSANVAIARLRTY